MGFEFTNPAVSAKYVPLRKADCKIHVPAGREKKGGYAGPLSGITLEAADKCYASKSNLLELKSGYMPPATHVKPEEDNEA